MLLVASAITFLAYGLQESRDVGTLQLAMAILGVVVLNAAMGFVQEYSSERTAESLSKAGVDVIETAITPQSRAAGCRLALPEGTVIRDGQPTVPAPEMRLQPGDELLIVSHAATEQEVHAAFQ